VRAAAFEFAQDGNRGQLLFGLGAFFCACFGVQYGFFCTRDTCFYVEAGVVCMCGHAAFGFFCTRISEGIESSVKQ
jgi:hypothetical protein